MRLLQGGSRSDDDKSVETDRVVGNSNEISMQDEACHGTSFPSCYRIPISKRKVACDWVDNFHLVERKSEMNQLCNFIAKARVYGLQVLSVWGIAGVGKSALVRNMYYDRIYRSDLLFDKYGWVDVTHPFNLRDFSRSLLLDFHSEPVQTMGIKDPTEDCRKILKDSRCLVVIDDLQSIEEWDLIQPALVSRPSGSIIIVITTEASIATHCADNEGAIFNVKGLEDEAAFELFKTQVLKKNPSSPIKDSKEAELQELILKCGGLPKVIVSVADFLAPKTITWMDSASALNLKFMQELESSPEFSCLQALFGWMHSYFRTCPDFLKPCIFYLSIFPRDHSIRRRRLVRRWIAEGYSRDTDKSSAEERGEWFFCRLLDLSIIVQKPYSLTTGYLQDGKPIAVKKLADNSPVAPEKQFQNEVCNLMAVQHENIVKLVGYCHEAQKKVIEHNGRYILVDVIESLLCYEYAPNGNLDKYIFDESSRPNWATCFKIIKGICQGLQFLHKGTDRPIVHLDLQPANILLAENMVPKIADFGLSRLFGPEQTRINTINVVGAKGYMAPEYLYRGEISSWSDIYSLRVLIIEITTGEKNCSNDKDMSARNFLDQVRQTWTDEHIASKYSSLGAGSLQEVKICIEIGLKCVDIDQKKRPSIDEIVHKLHGRHAR